MSHRIEKGNSTGDFYEEDRESYDDHDGWSTWYGHDEFGSWDDTWWTDDACNYNDEYQDDAAWYPWTGDPASEPGYQGEDRSFQPFSQAENDSVYSAGRGRGKGAGPFGSGCFICGSKWHLAADCPVRAKGKGKDKGKSKGKNKGSFQRSCPKCKSKSKCNEEKAKGKAGALRVHGAHLAVLDPGCHATSPTTRTTASIRRRVRGAHSTSSHARVCLRLGDSLPTELSPSPVPRAAKQVKYYDVKDPPGMCSEYVEELLRLERAVKPSSSSVETTSAPVTTEEPSGKAGEPLCHHAIKVIGLLLPQEQQRRSCLDSPRHQTYHESGNAEESEEEVYRTVHGTRRRGLIIDPGAANGLIGTETLSQHVDKAKEVNDTLVWKPKKPEVTGISGSADATLGEMTP